jgi:hypothetical protein
MLRKSLMIGLGLLWAMCSLAAVELEIVRSVRVSFQTDEGNQYQVYTTTDIDSGKWVASGDPIEGTGEVYTFNRDSDQTNRIFIKVEEIPEILTIDDLVEGMRRNTVRTTLRPRSGCR